MSQETHVIDLKSKSEYQSFVSANKRTIIFYGAVWCKECTPIKDLYRRISNRYHTKIAFAYVDVDEAKLDFTMLPVFASTFEGKEADNLLGNDTDSLKNFIRDAIRCKKHDEKESNNENNEEKEDKSEMKRTLKDEDVKRKFLPDVKMENEKRENVKTEKVRPNIKRIIKKSDVKDETRVAKKKHYIKNNVEQNKKTTSDVKK